MMEFHISRKARERYKFDESLFSLSGNVILVNLHASRQFAQKMNDRRDLVNFPEQAVRAGQINAMGLIDEILHLVINLYRQQKNPNLLQDAEDWLNGLLGKEAVDAALVRFVEEFPPLVVYQRKLTVDEYLKGVPLLREGKSLTNRQIAIEELILLWLANVNPAFTPYMELFDDSNLARYTQYQPIIAALHAFFDTQPVFGPVEQNPIDMLRSPALAVPHSLSGQLDYIQKQWGYLLGKLLYRLLSGLDLVKEEEKAIFLGPGPSRVIEFRGLELEAERFSPDKEWMPRLVLIAKNAYVWLDQLSKKYSRPIVTLDEIPDEELEMLSRWGFSGLWLIGLWERSAASRRIKQMRGNPDAVASAYSLYDYQIAADLGEESALHNLHERAWRYGIRLASDMVPNHMGIDSHWVIEHPDWFINQDYSPYPSYTFNGANLSWDDRVEINIEDHYYTNTDAAVVFRRVDRWSGTQKFIYHGNDGTSMPWNDTAQLNFLNSEVREAVIQTIIQVARNFPVIRFDAAMTLAKKHYQRLWFPEPGTGGAIPSRADHGMTKEQFDALMPIEFWREIVDRLAQDAPDTLLLAEAFWLMEGYFVRTLGMHRVYNSAFMNMLRDEKNAEYRLVVKNTLEFDPEILKRYVNFMNNPDERTAVDQYGKGDKYFGICTMMATMPGLPMFGHGQIEGYTEKYGMEFHRAYWEEYPDSYLVQRHERQIFPLLQKRYLFAEVQNFYLYDFYSPEGYVNEDVFAYSNRAENEHTLVIYHNKYASAKGWIRNSVAFAVKEANGERKLNQKTLGEGLNLSTEANTYTIFRDTSTGLEYLRLNQDLHEKGLYIELEAYQCHVLMDFRQVIDNEWRQYAHLAEYLNGRGVPSIAEAMQELFLQPIHMAINELVNAGWFTWIINHYQQQTVAVESTRVGGSNGSQTGKILDEAENKITYVLREIKKITNSEADEILVAQEIRRKLSLVLSLPALQNLVRTPEASYVEASEYLLSRFNQNTIRLGTLLGWLFTHLLGKISSLPEPNQYLGQSLSWLDEWQLGKIISTTLRDLGLDESLVWRNLRLVRLLISHTQWFQVAQKSRYTTGQVLQDWLKDGEFRELIGVNRYQGILWFNKEAFAELLWWMFVIAVIEILANAGNLADNQQETATINITLCYKLIKQIQQAEHASGYQLANLLKL